MPSRVAVSLCRWAAATCAGPHLVSGPHLACAAPSRTAVTASRKRTEEVVGNALRCSGRGEIQTESWHQSLPCCLRLGCADLGLDRHSCFFQEKLNFFHTFLYFS